MFHVRERRRVHVGAVRRADGEGRGPADRAQRTRPGALLLPPHAPLERGPDGRRAPVRVARHVFIGTAITRIPRVRGVAWYPTSLGCWRLAFKSPRTHSRPLEIGGRNVLGRRRAWDRGNVDRRDARGRRQPPREGLEGRRGGVAIAVRRVPRGPDPAVRWMRAAPLDCAVPRSRRARGSGGEVSWVRAGVGALLRGSPSAVAVVTASRTHRRRRASARSYSRCPASIGRRPWRRSPRVPPDVSTPPL